MHVRISAVLLIWGAATAAAQPVISQQGVTNAASYSILQAGPGGVAPGSIIVIFGTGLGPATLEAARAYPLLTELAGTRVQIGGASAYVMYTSANQVAAVVPSSGAGTHPLTVSYQSATSAPVGTPVIAAEFGIFTRNVAGYGQAAAQTVLLPGADIRTIGLATSARLGEPVVLYGTGLGAIPNAPDDRPPGAARAVVPVEVVIGGRTVAPDYAGRSPNYAGLDQINFTVPADLTPGCYVPVAVRANGRQSNSVSVPVARAGRTCPHVFGLPDEAAARVDGGGTITIAQALGELQSSEAGLVGEGIGIGFAEVDANSLETSSDPSDDPNEPTDPGLCAVETSEDNRTVTQRPSVSRPRFLDAGAVVRLRGPAEYSADLPRTPGSSYGMNLPNGTLRPGTWTLSSGGGSDIGAFELSADLPEPLTWTNRQASVDRAQPLRIEWSNGGAGPVRVVVSTGSQTGFSSITCWARAQDGGITIPAATVSRLPAGASGGVVISQSVERSGYTVPLVRGGNVEGTLFRLNYQTSGSIRVQ